MCSINVVALRRIRLVPGKPSRCITSHPGQLILAIFPWVGAMSTSERTHTQRHTTWCISPVSVVSQCYLVSDWGLVKRRSAPHYGRTCMPRKRIGFFIQRNVDSVGTRQSLQKIVTTKNKQPLNTPRRWKECCWVSYLWIHLCISSYNYLGRIRNDWRNTRRLPKMTAMNKSRPHTEQLDNISNCCRHVN